MRHECNVVTYVSAAVDEYDWLVRKLEETCEYRRVRNDESVESRKFCVAWAFP